jgi:hypothetical protein
MMQNEAFRTHKSRIGYNKPVLPYDYFFCDQRWLP